MNNLYKFKACPYRVTRILLTDTDFSDTFPPCAGDECAAYEGGYCKRNPYTAISVLRGKDDE